MDLTIKIIEAFGYVIYAALALLAVWGVYNAILLYRSLAKKSIGQRAPNFLDQVRELLKAGKSDAAAAVAQGPPYWHTALAQLVAVALKNRDKGIPKIKQILVMEFHTEVIAGMENRLASISTIVRMGPLLGLLGTVASMIGAFGRIGGSEKVNA
ncbi:MotA/TolQ/ExbB proton channel family protein, partial [Singulisphaera rosea]